MSLSAIGYMGPEEIDKCQDRIIEWGVSKYSQCKPTTKFTISSKTIR
jgi:hypothetical protein